MTELCTCEFIIDNDECQCSMTSSDCLTVAGSGNTNPITVTGRLNPDVDNLVSCAVDGLLVEAPAWLRNPPRAQVYNNADISLADDDGTPVTFNSEYFDTDTMHSTVTDTSRITVVTPGIYVITFSGEFASNAVGDRQAVLRRNGTDFFAGSEKPAVNGTVTSMNVVAAEYFRAGEFIEVYAKQDSGGSLNLLATRNSPVFTALFKRPPPT